MYHLYWERLSGAIAPQAILEEIGCDYRTIPIDMAAGAHRSEEYRRVCPTSRVPALTTPDGETVGETVAILLLLAERHPKAAPVPAPGDPDRARFLFWLMHIAVHGYPAFSRAWHPEQFAASGPARDDIARRAEAELASFFALLDGQVAGGDTFLASGFSALDIYLSMLTLWSADRAALLDRHAALGRVCRATDARASMRRVLADHGLAPAA